MNPISVDIDFADPQGGAPWRYWLEAPVELIQAYQIDDVLPALQAVRERAEAGFWCAGAVAYEAATAFDTCLTTRVPTTPLVWFAVFDRPQAAPSLTRVSRNFEAYAHWPDAFQSDAKRNSFNAGMSAISEQISRGDYYQVNFTGRYEGRLCTGQSADYFSALCAVQPNGYSAHIDAGDWQLLSVSPELFFDWDCGRILCRPMKGTAPRASTAAADLASAQALLGSAKEQAENVMVVDLIRNDLSRIARPFSVAVSRLFHLQALPTVWQMTSDVWASARDGLTWVDAFTSLFPCGSVTGAPKSQAMRAIVDLETQSRGWYCGAIGLVRPDGAARFSVAIRTVYKVGHMLSCGIGSGITADASADNEWAEWKHKRVFLQRASAPFELLETLAVENGHLRYGLEHWNRLTRTARHFGWRWGREEQRLFTRQLEEFCSSHTTGMWRLRCSVAADGRVRLTGDPLAICTQPVNLVVAEEPFAWARSEWVRFKTTRREHYERAAVKHPEAFDTLLHNEEGEITECTRGNIAALIDGQWVTPPEHCGLLPGVGRWVSLRQGRLTEAVIRIDQIEKVQSWAFLNSLRGWLPAQLLDCQASVKLAE